MKTILENELQEIKDLEQRIKDEKEFVRSSLIAAVKEVYHPDVKKIGSILQVIQYKDLDNWDVKCKILEHFLCTYIEQRPFSTVMQIIRRLEDGVQQNKQSVDFSCYLIHEKIHMRDWRTKVYHEFSVSQILAKRILENFYKKLESKRHTNDISAV